MTQEQEEYFTNVLWEYIQDEFDFKKVKKVIDILEWTWVGKIPTIEQIMKQSYELCLTAYKDGIENNDYCMTMTGGLEASYIPKLNSLELRFVIEHSDTEFLDDEDDL